MPLFTETQPGLGDPSILIIYKYHL